MISPKVQLNELPMKDNVCIYPIQPLFLTLGVVNVYPRLFFVALISRLAAENETILLSFILWTSYLTQSVGPDNRRNSSQTLRLGGLWKALISRLTAEDEIFYLGLYLLRQRCLNINYFQIPLWHRQCSYPRWNIDTVLVSKNFPTQQVENIQYRMSFQFLW